MTDFNKKSFVMVWVLVAFAVVFVALGVWSFSAFGMLGYVIFATLVMLVVSVFAGFSNGL